MNFLANSFGYLLNFLYNLFDNYGLALILFSIILKVALLPISIKQQRTMKKSAKLQAEMKMIQAKYSSDQAKANEEIMSLYKRNNMSPFSGCFSSIIQIVLLLSVFFLVSKPLTYMRKVEPSIIENYKNEIAQQLGEGKKMNYEEIHILREKGSADERIFINMNFLGVDLSNVPSSSKDWKAYIIPGLYVISSFISIRLTTKMQQNKKQADSDSKTEETTVDTMASTNKTMNIMLPILSISIAIVAPLGLALYWLINNILMIVERIVLDRMLSKEEEE